MLVHIYGKARNTNDPRFVFLHGYPGVRSNQNRDVAEKLAEEFQCEAHVLLYSGLTQAPGEFSFRACLEDVDAYLASIVIPSRGPLNLVGHSWGGFLALNMISKYNEFIKRVALMSPLLYFPKPMSEPEDRLRVYFEEMAKENPALHLGRTEDRLREFTELGTTSHVDQLIEQVPVDVPVLFLQAEKDEITPTEIAQKKRAYFRAPVTFELVATDHSFLTGRDVLAERLIQFFR